MANVPSYDNLKSDVTVKPDAQFSQNYTPEIAAQPGQQMQKLGAAQGSAGDAGAKIALDEAGLANQTRVNDAMNQVRQHALDLTYGNNDPNNPVMGYQQLKGKDALEVKDADGKPTSLSDAYGQKLNEKVNEVANSLSNPDQQRLFQEQSNDLQTQFHGEAEQHMMGEYKDFHVSTNNGAATLAQQKAGALGITNPAATAQQLDIIKSSIVGNQRFNGLSADEVQADINKQVSAVHGQAVDSALQNGDITGAADWYSKNKGEMVPEDLLRTQLNLNQHVDSYNAMHAVGQSSQSMSSRFLPGSSDQLFNLMFGQESGNKQVGGPGSIAGPNEATTSPKGAIGIAQIEPGTGPEAAKAAGLAWDENKFRTDGDYNLALGKAYFGEQLKKYGDVSMALAAYNAGPGALDAALSNAHGKNDDANWLQYLPAETQNYVTKIGGQFESGQGTPSVPTETEFVSDAVSRLGDNPRIEAVKATREAASAQYEQLTKSRDEMAQQSQGRVQAELLQNGGSMLKLSPGAQEDVRTVNRLDPSKGADLLRYARYAKTDEQQTTNTNTYVDDITHPDQLAQMSDVDFENHLKTNYSPADQEKVANIRADAINGKSTTSALSINSQAVTQALNNRLASLGITAATKKSNSNDEITRSSAISDYIIRGIFDQQQQMGRKMTPEEIQTFVGDQFQQSTTLPGALYGSRVMPTFGAKASDIPSNEKKAITDTYAKHGINAPSDTDLLEGWFKLRGNKSAVKS